MGGFDRCQPRIKCPFFKRIVTSPSFRWRGARSAIFYDFSRFKETYLKKWRRGAPAISHPLREARREESSMSRHLRYQPEPWATHFVTTRCTHGYALLRPGPQVNALILGCLGRALERQRGEIELHHYVFMSNHFHLLISSVSAHAKSKFMCHLNSNIARELCRVWGWREHLWEGRYASDVVLDEEALVTALKYIFKNSVKELLVEHPRLWPGAHGWAPLCGGERAVGRWVDRSALFFARQTKRGQRLTEEDFTRVIEVSLCPPRFWRELSAEEYQGRCARLAEEAVEEVIRTEVAEAERRASPVGRRVDFGLELEGEGRGGRDVCFLGAEAVCEQPVFEARVQRRRPRPLCRARCPRVLAAFVESYRVFRDLFRGASARLRVGLLRDGCAPIVRFPVGGVPIFL